MITQKTKAFAKKNWLPLTGFGISTLVALWFIGHFVADVIYFNDPRHQDEALKPWMTPRYVVLSYDLPRDVVFDALDIPETGERPPRMKDIVEKRGITLGELTAQIRAAAENHRQQRP